VRPPPTDLRMVCWRTGRYLCQGCRRPFCMGHFRSLVPPLCHYCYEDGVTASAAAVVGAIAIFPELDGKVPEAARALRAWDKFEVQGEGVAIT
jgi:hypothetical protein